MTKRIQTIERLRHSRHFAYKEQTIRPVLGAERAGKFEIQSVKELEGMIFIGLALVRQT